MPRIPDDVLEAVAFLYPTPADAERHAKLGGTCFLVGKPIIHNGNDTGHYVPYYVTNRHVAITHGCPVVRVNRNDGAPPTVIDLDCSEWIGHPGGDDIAIALVTSDRAIDISLHAIRMLPVRKILTRQQMADLRVGVGDEVLMPGRFLNHQGRFYNRTSVRFGNISMMEEPIWNRSIQKDQESFAVEMRSRTGFSGSPGRRISNRLHIYRAPYDASIFRAPGGYVGLYPR